MDEFSDLAGRPGTADESVGGAPPGAPGALSRGLPEPEPGPIRRPPGRPAGSRNAPARAPVRKRKKRDYKLEKALRDQRRGAGGSASPAPARAAPGAPPDARGGLASARQVQDAHRRVAELLRDDDWLLSPDEAQEVAEAHAEFARLTGIQLTQSSLGWLGILWTAGSVYGLRFIRMARARAAAADRERAEAPPSPPAPAPGAAHTLGAASPYDIPPPPAPPGPLSGLDMNGGLVMAPGVAPQVYGTITPIMHPHELNEL